MCKREKKLEKLNTQIALNHQMNDYKFFTFIKNEEVREKMKEKAFMVKAHVDVSNRYIF